MTGGGAKLSLRFYEMSVSRFQDWLLFTICSCVLYLTGIFSPILAAPATLLISFPTAYLAFQYGAIFALSSVFFSSAVIVFTLSGVWGLLYFTLFGMTGTIIGLMTKAKLEGGNLLIASTTVEFFGKLGGVLLIHQFYGVNLLSPDAAEIRKSVIAYGTSHLTEETAYMIIDSVILLVPYLIILFSALEALSCLVLLSYINKKRTGETAFCLPPFTSWRFPKSILLTLVVGFICEKASSIVGGNSYLLKQIGANLGELSKTIFILQGLSCAYFFMEKHGIPKPMRIIVVVMTSLVSFLGDIFAIVGVADLGFNFRERKDRKPR